MESTYEVEVEQKVAERKEKKKRLIRLKKIASGS